ncbi:MAG: glycoside hydrolase family 95 protein [Sphingobacteriales bacterium]|nr:MAG: glycoside hydrolase family 95 protein [Sphingobacteriales bacterium]TAF80760.1 MAG: glycoside hydrolase family 95 protein [Sphingobacteriales bacterium]
MNFYFKLLYITFILSNIFTANAQQPKQQPMLLWYKQPAPQKDSIPYGKNLTPNKWGTINGWDYALPIGNGRLGAMLFGGVNHERIQLNEETLWGGYKIVGDNPQSGPALPKIRQLLFDAKVEDATKLAEKTFLGVPEFLDSYQSLSDLFIDDLNPTKKYDNYYRDLSIDSALAKVKYRVDGKLYSREMFASHPNQVIVIKYTCGTAGRLNLRLSMNRERDAKTYSVENDNSTLIQAGQITAYDSIAKINKGLKFQTQLKVINTGGRLESKDGFLTVKNAKQVIILIVAATNYYGGNPAQLCTNYLNKVKGLSYPKLKQNHINDYTPLFARTKIKLGENKAIDLPTDERISNATKGVYDTYLSELAYNFGKYILISSSRPGDLPANLQGLWCQHNIAPWNSDYHANINLQMNYWGAEVANLSECHLPLFDLIDSVAIPGAHTAKTSYNAKGWLLHHATDAYWRTSPIDGGVVGIWPFGGAWLTRHLWEHYLYTGDKQFLQQRAYPLMKGSAQFMLDFLVKIPKGLPFEGKWVTNPSHSPENAYQDANGVQSMFTYGATMDLEIIHDLFTNCIDAINAINGKTGKQDLALKAQLVTTLAQLVPLQISKKTGKIQEWIEDYKELELGHRHISHLYGLFPGKQITLALTPKLAAAAALTIDARLKGNPNWEKDEASNKYPSFSSYLNGEGGGNWQRAWLTALWARLGNGEQAFDSHKRQFNNIIMPNLLGDGRVQVDGSMGLTGAVTEMLLQSHEGYIHILPALPNEWKTGFITGIKARGGFTVDINWKNTKLTRLKITSQNGTLCTLKLNNCNVIKVLSANKPIKFTLIKNNVVRFATVKNKNYTIISK